MKSTFRVLLFFIAGGVLVARGDEKAVIDAHRLRPATEAQIKFWHTTTPCDLITLLRKQPGAFFTVDSECQNYVEADDIPKLVQLLDSKEPCAYLLSSACSFAPAKKTTVGNQAAYLILCFKEKKCPSGLSGWGDYNVVEYKEWYRSWRLQNPERFPEI